MQPAAPGPRTGGEAMNRDFRTTVSTVIALAICILLQSTILGRVAIRGVRPDLAMLVLVFVSMRRGPDGGPGLGVRRRASSRT